MGTTPSTTEPASFGAGERGQATTEFAISLLLLVPLVVGMTVMGELLSVGAKVQEAEIESEWEISAYQLHDYISGGDARYGPPLREASQQAFDDFYFGLSSWPFPSPNATPGRTLPFLTISPLVVKCRRFDVPIERQHNEPNFKPLLPFDSVAAYDYLNNQAAVPIYSSQHSAAEYLHVYVPGGTNNSTPTFLISHIVCRGSVAATQQLTGFDANYQSWTHEHGLLDTAPPSFTFCGIGETLRGCTGPPHNPNGGMVLLTDDWGLDDGASADDTLKTTGASGTGTSTNVGYTNVGHSIYGGGLGTIQVNKAMQHLLGVADQTDTNSFKYWLLDRLSDERKVSSDVGIEPTAPAIPVPVPKLAHLTPYEAQGGMPELLYSGRANGHYLGNPNPDFEDSP